jgi:predicted ester cyclase
VRLKGVVVLRIAGGRIVERWGEFDALGLMRQLGMEVRSETAEHG